MTKLNLKELREDCESDKNCEFQDDRIINFKTIMLLLDWIERARELIQYCIMYQVDDDEVKLGRKLLAELEEA